MTISGVGPIASLPFKATIGEPKSVQGRWGRGCRSGLTPRTYQPGEI